MLGARSVFALGVALVGCNPDQGEPTVDLVVQDAGQEAGADAGASAPGQNGATCKTPADCASGFCFIGGQGNFCSIPCTVANAATVCAAPPFIGVCNMQGFCKKG